MKKRRLIFTLEEGITLNGLFESSGLAPNPESIYFSHEDKYAENHRFPLTTETKESEHKHYNARFYNALEKKQQDLYRTYTIDTETEEDLERYQAFFKQRLGLVKNAYEDGMVKFLNAPNDPDFDKQKAMFDKLQIEEAWNIATKKGQNIIVSVIDTGVSTIHPDLMGNLWINKNTDKVGYTYSDLPMSDQSAKPNGHGTPVSGIISSLGNEIGIAPKSQIQMHMLKVSADEAFMSDCKRAINNSKGISKIINCSFEIGSTTQQAQDDFITFINHASEEMLFVFAAGNSIGGRDIEDTFLHFLPNVLKVGALDTNDSIAADSNFGKSVVFGYRNTFTTTKTNGYASFGGTSAAAPQISAICALILSHNINVKAKKLKEIIEKSCDKIPAITSNLGVGRVSANKALERTIKEFGPFNPNNLA